MTTGLLARNLDRRSTLSRVLRLDAVICITVTSVVFHLALASLQEVTGWDALADFLPHTLSPIACRWAGCCSGREATSRRASCGSR